MNLCKHIPFGVYFLFISISSLAQIKSDLGFDPAKRGDDGLRIMFYNVENLFDIYDDPRSSDHEFTAESDKRWTYYRYSEKLNHLAKVIIAVGGWEAPELVGLCEVENFQVVLDLVSKTPLKRYGYQVIHENSPDRRGIDNAIIFRPEKLSKMQHLAIAVETGEQLITRDILYSSFIFRKKDTIHLFVNHWPSRFGGKELTQKKRLSVASVLQESIREVQVKYQNPKVIAMGDFNDQPSDRSLIDVLGAVDFDGAALPMQLYNMSFIDFKNGKGTIVYKEIDPAWYMFDQMIVTGTLLSGDGLQVRGRKSHIYAEGWLLNNGKPHRSYQGPIYLGGFSDHLPIFIDLYSLD